MKRYAIVIEQGTEGCSAYCPDLPGCIAAGDTLGEVRRLMGEALAFHLEGMQLAGETIPEPCSIVEYVEVKDPRQVAPNGSAPAAKSKRRARA